MALRLNPISDAVELITGQDIVTGEDLALWERALNAVGFVPGVGSLDDLREAAKVAKALDTVQEAKGLAKVATKAERIREAARLGRLAERAVGIPEGAKKLIEIGDRLRVPDWIKEKKLLEVKNVAKQGWTAQLKDYAEFAKSNKLQFQLYVRSDTELSRKLRKAQAAGQVTIKHIPGM